MQLGDLVKFIERHPNGVVKETIGLVVEKLDPPVGMVEKPIYRIKWFEEEIPDSWHSNPEEYRGPRDLHVISSVEAGKIVKNKSSKKFSH